VPLRAWAVEDAAGASRLVLAVAIAPGADRSEWTSGQERLDERILL
jgi:hypothetical protein